jgi:dipeptidyl aminopeptidase/acylaminoacyl peptidase
MKKITVTIWCLIFLFIFTGWNSRLDGNEGKESQWQWQVDDLLTTDQIDEYRLSPDGKNLAWTISQWNVKEQKKYNILYLTPLEGKKKELKKIRLTRGEDAINSIQWVPGENKITLTAVNPIP